MPVEVKTNCTSTSSTVMNMFILGIAILIVMLIKQRFEARTNSGEPFVGVVPMTSIGNGNPYGPSGTLLGPGTQPYGQPMMYDQQLYPAKLPWYNETGRPCSGDKGCGAVGVCQNGVCSVKDGPHDTVFDIRV